MVMTLAYSNEMLGFDVPDQSRCPQLMFTYEVDDDGDLQGRARLQQWDVRGVNTLFCRVTHAVAVVRRRGPEPVRVALPARVI